MYESKIKEILTFFNAIAKAPPECSDCVAFCAEGHISTPCRGDWFVGCENRTDYNEEHNENN